ncbi:MAG: TIGR02281 family clan AA aspartic protease [Xanthobacteraceae bacterium]
MRGVLILAGVMIGLGTVMSQVADHMMAASATTTSSAPSVMLAATESSAPSSVRSVVVPRDRHGHFQTEGRIEGQRIKFMVDTGASVIAMNETSAARIGVRPAQSEFNAKVTTANGVIKAARTRLAMVQIGDLVVRDVDAMVLPDEALSQNLLGLSFLGKLKRFEFAGGRMVLEQ